MPKFLNKFSEIRRSTENYISNRSYVEVVIPGEVA